MSPPKRARAGGGGPGLAVGALLALVFLMAMGTPGRADTPGKDSVAKSPPAAGFVGAETCMTCHEAQGRGYTNSPHSRVWNARTPAAAEGCETCHGPGQRHIENPADKTTITSFVTMAPRDVSEKCTTCHNREEHAQWQGSMHNSRNITCITCHSVHDPKSEKAQLKKVSVTATCQQCHRDKAARLQRTGHMPVREGKMECTSCHNQHGSTNVRMLRTGNSVVEFCVSCHTEKRGPFLWEHPPVRENCTTCHDPHGSSNDRLLVAKPPMLCQRCHVSTRHPSTIYDNVAVSLKNNRIIGRGCVNCHSNIHGSNHPSGSKFQR